MITRHHQDAETVSSATYSACETYRYALTRTWDPDGAKVMFVMLNPSKATEAHNDPTVGRCENRARALGFGAFRVTNLFALRETDPKIMRRDQSGPSPPSFVSALLLGTLRADDLRGGDGDDLIDGGAGEDQLRGADGDDQLFGGKAMDSLFGGMGDDLLDGGDHEDDLIGGAGNDTLDGGADNDTLQGGFGDDTLQGGTGQDLMNGGAGDDTLDGAGDDEADFLNGGRGDDLLIAGKDDQVHGGEGADTFALDAQDAGAFIADYDPDQDVIEVVYDADAPVPELTTAATQEGLALYADGEFVAGFANVTSIDLNRIALVAA